MINGEKKKKKKVLTHSSLANMLPYQRTHFLYL